MPPEFQSQQYWHERFKHETSFEWLVSSASFLSITESLLARLPSTARILHLGCGTSDLHNSLRRRRFLCVTYLDYVPLGIYRCRQAEEREFGDVQMTYLVGDATEVDPGEQIFDLVIDKGTADAIACSGDEAVMSLAKAMKSCLADDGMWISLSFSASRYDLKELPFSVEVISKIPTPKARETDPEIHYYYYLLRAQNGKLVSWGLYLSDDCSQI